MGLAQARSRRVLNRPSTHQRVRDELLLHYDQSRFRAPADLVLCHPQLGVVLDPAKLRRRFQAAARGASPDQVSRPAPHIRHPHGRRRRAIAMDPRMAWPQRLPNHDALRRLRDPPIIPRDPPRVVQVCSALRTWHRWLRARCFAERPISRCSRSRGTRRRSFRRDKTREHHTHYGQRAQHVRSHATLRVAQAQGARTSEAICAARTWSPAPPPEHARMARRYSMHRLVIALAGRERECATCISSRFGRSRPR